MPAPRGFTRQARIDRPREQVWAFMTDLSNSPKWITGLMESVLITQGPMGPGSKIRETRTLGRYTETYEIEVKAFEPPRSYAAAAKAGKAEFVFTYELTDAVGATDITLRATMDGKGLGFRLFAGMGMKMMEKYDGDQLQRLKAAVEKGP